MRALAVLCKDHGGARMNFMERASIGQVARALEDSDLQVHVCSEATHPVPPGAVEGIMLLRYYLMLVYGSDQSLLGSTVVSTSTASWLRSLPQSSQSG